MANHDPLPIQVDTLTRIRLEKADVKKQLDASTKRIKEQFGVLTARKPTPSTLSGRLLGFFDQGTAIIEGVVIGMKIFGSIKKLFKRKH